MWLLPLIACPAAQLGVELPPGGVDAISHEDLRRDVRLLTGADPAAEFAGRLAQMAMVPAAPPAGVPTSATCAARGQGPRPGGKPALLLAPWPANPDTATAAAALISVAKAWDLSGGAGGRVTLCLLAAGTPLVETLAGLPPGVALGVGPLASGAAHPEGACFVADPPDPARPAERINYTDLQSRVKTLFGEL